MKEFQPLSSLITAAIPPTADRPAAAALQQKLAHHWHRQAVPAAAHSQPLLFASGRLVVFAESASWGNEIRHRSHSIKQTLTGNGIPLTSIEVKILPNSPPPTRRPGKPPPNLSPQTAQQIQQLAATITHPQLKASLLKLAKRGDGG